MLIHKSTYPWRAGFAVFGCAMLVAGCAGNSPASVDNEAAPKSAKERALAASQLKTGTFSAGGIYELSNEERRQSCKRITGKMNIRIVQLQRSGIVRDSSTLARKFGGFFGNDSKGLSSAERRKRERAVLDSYNALLAKKGCKTFDLDKELRQASPASTRQPGAGIAARTR